MSKQEFHIALLCIALIAAGVIGYQIVNGEFGSPGENTIKVDIYELATPSSYEPTGKIKISPPLFESPLIDRIQAELSDDASFPLELIPADQPEDDETLDDSEKEMVIKKQQHSSPE